MGLQRVGHVLMTKQQQLSHHLVGKRQNDAKYSVMHRTTPLPELKLNLAKNIMLAVLKNPLLIP